MKELARRLVKRGQADHLTCIDNEGLVYVAFGADQVERVAAVRVPAWGERHLPARAGQPGNAHSPAVDSQQFFQRFAIGRLSLPWR
jgi:hypothetical protein